MLAGEITQGLLDFCGREGAADPGPVEGGFEAVEFGEELLDVGGSEEVELGGVGVLEGGVAEGAEEGADEFVGCGGRREDGGVEGFCDGGFG